MTKPNELKLDLVVNFETDFTLRKEYVTRIQLQVLARSVVSYVEVIEAAITEVVMRVMCR